MTMQMQETEDADFLIYTDLMDGRDGLLSVAMERHYEFSSHRRAMFSTMLMLFEISHPDDQNVFMCSSCNLHFSKGLDILQTSKSLFIRKYTNQIWPSGSTFHCLSSRP